MDFSLSTIEKSEVEKKKEMMLLSEDAIARICITLSDKKSQKGERERTERRKIYLYFVREKWIRTSSTLESRRRDTRAQRERWKERGREMEGEGE